MKSHAEVEFNSDLIKEGQSRDVTIENLIQRNKDLVLQNDKLNVKKGLIKRLFLVHSSNGSTCRLQDTVTGGNTSNFNSNPKKCFEAAKMINDLGIELAKVRINRYFSCYEPLHYWQHIATPFFS